MAETEQKQLKTQTNTASMPIKAKPYEHQIRAFNFVLDCFEKSGSAAILADMGTGKSLITIAVTGFLANESKIRKILIVCPLSVVGVWQEEFLKFANFDYELAILKGGTDHKIQILRSLNGENLQVAVVNYESIRRLEKEIMHWNPDFIICDEAHKIKCHKIAASKSLHRLGAKAKYRLILTGTLVTNKAIDVFSPYKFLNPSIFGNSFYSFRNRYFDMIGYGNHTPILKKSMESELKEKIHDIAFRATKAQCLDLPETQEITRFVELELSAMNTYKKLVKDSFAELSKGEITITNVLTKILRLSQLTGGFLSNDKDFKVQKISNAKLQALDDIIENVLESNQKLVVIVRFIPEIKAICKLLEKKKIKFSLITGEVKNRAEEIEKFQNNPEIKVFVGQIATAGLGITLTASSTMVFYSLDYSMSNFEQAQGRIHRVGQKQNCTYIYLIARNTIDEKVLQALKDKSNLAKSLIDDYRLGGNPFEINFKNYGGRIDGKQNF
jgi:SNF2 family DNA or RNA helicase